MTGAGMCIRGTDMKKGFFPAFIVAALLIALSALPVGVSAAESTPVLQELDVGLGYAGQEADQVYPAGELNTALKYVASLQVSRDLLLRFGAEWQSFSFPAPRPSAAPSSLQQANVIVGVDYQLAEQWLMRAELQPGLYGDLNRFDGRRFGAPLMVGFVYLVDADLQWLLGLRVDYRSQYPVFPAAGVRWKFADLWTLNLMLPNPRLEYDVNSKLQTYLGAAILAGTYVVADHYGDDRNLPQLNNATLEYTELRLGPGLSWKVRPNLTLDAEAGYVVYRSWDFFEQHINPTGHAVPYLQLGLHAHF
jgi:opacity protein-like surface antigen